MTKTKLRLTIEAERSLPRPGARGRNEVNHSNTPEPSSRDAMTGS